MRTHAATFKGMVDEPTLLRVRRAINEGRIKRRPQGTEIPVLMGLQGEEGYPHEGTVNFVNNQVDPATGSILVRGVFPNPEPPGGVRLLSPGMFVRIRLPIGQPHPALLVIDRAVGSDQGLKYVYVLDADDRVRYRRVTTRALQPDGLRAIESGVGPDDWIVVGGLPQVRPGMQVRPDRVPMPTLSQADGTPAPPATTGTNGTEKGAPKADTREDTTEKTSAKAAAPAGGGPGRPEGGP